MYLALQIIALSLVSSSVQGKLVEVGVIPAKLANPKDVTTNFKQCNQIAFPPKGSDSSITSLGNLADKDLTQNPIFMIFDHSPIGLSFGRKWPEIHFTAQNGFLRPQRYFHIP